MSSTLPSKVLLAGKMTVETVLLVTSNGSTKYMHKHIDIGIKVVKEKLFLC